MAHYGLLCLVYQDANAAAVAAAAVCVQHAARLKLHARPRDIYKAWAGNSFLF